MTKGNNKITIETICKKGNCEIDVGPVNKGALIKPKEFGCELGYVSAQCPGYVVCELLEDSEDLRCPAYKEIRKNIFLSNGNEERLYAAAVRKAIREETKRLDQFESW